MDGSVVVVVVYWIDSLVVLCLSLKTTSINLVRCFHCSCLPSLHRWTVPPHSLAHEIDMQTILNILRYVILGMGLAPLNFSQLIPSLALLVICNAIIASVAVWNQSLSPASASVCAYNESYSILILIFLSSLARCLYYFHGRSWFGVHFHYVNSFANYLLWAKS